MQYAIENDSDESISVFYVNNEKTTKIFREAGRIIPSDLKNLDGYIHSIDDNGSPVKDVKKKATGWAVKIIQEMSEHIAEEIKDAECYAKMAIHYQESEPEAADLFFSLSKEEM